MEKLVERFLNYIRFNTASDAESNEIPSTEGQVRLGKYLHEELEQMGVEARIGNAGIVYGHLPANCSECNIPSIGFVAHMDTPQHLNCDSIKPNFVENYDGKPVLLNEEKGIFLDPKKDTFLKDLIGHDLITTDGTTILGQMIRRELPNW